MGAADATSLLLTPDSAIRHRWMALPYFCIANDVLAQ
jgi:hypothetical protein